jgi:phosphoglycolate phosphatase
LSDLLALVFDLDGTLIDSAPDIHATANKVFQANGLEGFSFETVKGFIGNGVGALVARLLESQGLAAGGDLYRDMVEKFVKTYEEAVDLTQLYPNVLQALTQLSAAGHPMAICTNKPVGAARAILRHFGIEDMFPVLIGGDSLTVRKPDPAPLHAAIADLGARTALFVGDSEIDAATADAAGVPLALFTEGYRKAGIADLAPRLVFDNFGALPGLISHLAPKLQALAPRAR